MRPVELVCFDLGNTLVRYFTSREFPDLLEAAIARATVYLWERGIAVPRPEEVRRLVAAENHEAPDHTVRPLEERLGRIFSLDGATLLEATAREFLAPLLEPGRRYDDVLPVLAALRGRGVRAALVSNTPWGSPAGPWRAELARHGLDGLLDPVVFCRDVGWRKPSPRIFRHVLDLVGVAPAQALFVGDHPAWDVAGPRACGLQAVLLDRERIHPGEGIGGLEEIVDLLG